MDHTLVEVVDILAGSTVLFASSFSGAASSCALVRECRCILHCRTSFHGFRTDQGKDVVIIVMKSVTAQKSQSSSCPSSPKQASASSSSSKRRTGENSRRIHSGHSGDFIFIMGTTVYVGWRLLYCAKSLSYFLLERRRLLFCFSKCRRMRCSSRRNTFQ